MADDDEQNIKELLIEALEGAARRQAARSDSEDRITAEIHMAVSSALDEVAQHVRDGFPPL